MKNPYVKITEENAREITFYNRWGKIAGVVSIRPERLTLEKTLEFKAFSEEFVEELTAIKGSAASVQLAQFRKSSIGLAGFLDNWFGGNSFRSLFSRCDPASGSNRPFVTVVAETVIKTIDQMLDEQISRTSSGDLEGVF